jgi:hypothetical protein
MASGIQPSASETSARDIVVGKIVEMVKRGEAIRLPAFDRSRGESHDDPALLRMGEEPNDFGGTVGDFRYQFEGEDDLLHLMVTRIDLQPLSVEDAQGVVAFVLPQVPPGLIWLKPATRSQHFHFGHDLLLEPTA